LLTLIDKIKISTPFDMRINADANINVSQLPINQQYREGLKKKPVIYINSEGEEISGIRATKKDKLFTISIYPNGGSLKFNFPKTAQFGINLHPIDKDEALNVIQLVQDRLFDYGITVDLSFGKLKYLEIYKNFVLGRPFYEYLDALKWLEIKRGLEKRFDTTHYFGNDTRKLVIYDKTKQLVDKNLIKKETGSLIGSVIRAEYRLYNQDVILRELGLGNLKDLIDSWDDLNELFNGSVESFIHRYEKKKIPVDLTFDTEADCLKYFFDNYGTSSGWNNYRKHFGSVQIMNRWNDVNDLRSTLRPYKSKEAISRHLKELREDSMALPVSSKQSVVGLLQEFKSMLLS